MNEPTASSRGRASIGAAVGAGARNTTTALRDIVVVILLLAGTFDGLSGNWPHAILLYTVAIALGRDAVRRRSTESLRPDAIVVPIAPASPETAVEEVRRQARRLVTVPLLLAAILAYAVVVGGFARYSWPTTVAIIIPGSVVLALSWNGPRRPRETPGPVGLVGTVAWLSVFIGLGLWELTQLLLQPSLTTDSWRHPTISVLSDPILASHPGRTVGLILWLLFGWFLLDR
jgi:hypothetical protein